MDKDGILKTDKDNNDPLNKVGFDELIKTKKLLTNLKADEEIEQLMSSWQRMVTSALVP